MVTPWSQNSPNLNYTPSLVTTQADTAAVAVKPLTCEYALRKDLSRYGVAPLDQGFESHALREGRLASVQVRRLRRRSGRHQRLQTVC